MYVMVVEELLKVCVIIGVIVFVYIFLGIWLILKFGNEK